MRTGIKINPNLITWAIERADYKLDEFIENFPKVREWIAKNKRPTIKQLEKFSSKVSVPFGYLFLQEPPKEDLPIPFFRSKKNKTQKVSLNVRDAILLLQRRQEWLSEYLKENDFKRREFVGKFAKSDNHNEIISDIRKTINLHKEWAKDLPNWGKALELLTERIEDAGIIITFNSVVGNNTHRSIAVEDCRGFVLIDSFAPFMFVNSKDAKAAQMFTIMHEIAHIWIGYSAGFDFRRMQAADDPIEKFCDKIAAEFLVPTETFDKAWKDNRDFKTLSRKFKVSPIVIARRALDLNIISKSAFFKFYDNYIENLPQKDKKSSGGDFYATVKNRLNLRFMTHLNQAVRENKILYRDAYKLTGLKGDTYKRFINKHLY